MSRALLASLVAVVLACPSPALAQHAGHAGHGQPSPAAPPPAPSGAPLEPIPALTAADRAAAFPVVSGHAAHDNAIHSWWLLDHFEQGLEADSPLAWEAVAWLGTDVDRLWLRSEGEHADGEVAAANIELLYGHSLSPWWELVGGMRHDFGQGPSETWAAIGLMGLAPYKVEVEATVYLGRAGQAAARLELEYDTLLGNRLILQWQLGADFHGRTDEARLTGAGLGQVEAGLRLRYELTRRFAPYIGLVHERSFGETAELLRSAGDETRDTRVVAGLRLWF